LSRLPRAVLWTMPAWSLPRLPKMCVPPDSCSAPSSASQAVWRSVSSTSGLACIAAFLRVDGAQRPFVQTERVILDVFGQADARAHPTYAALLDAAERDVPVAQASARMAVDESQA